MQKLYFKEGYVEGKWALNIQLDIDAHGMITAVHRDVKIPDTAEVYDTVLPAMPNLHSHAFQRAFAGLAEYKEAGQSDFWSWRNAMYHFAAQMTPEALSTITSALYVEMLKAGYTAVGEFHYLHNSHNDQALAMSEAIIGAADKSGIAVTHLPVLYQASDFGGKPAKAGQQPFLHCNKEFDRLLQVLKTRVGGRHQLGMAFHSLRAVPEENFDAAINAIENISLQAPIHIHIAEQMKEVDASVAHSGKRPVEWLMENQNVDERWCLVHATHVQEHEWKAIAESGAVVGLCPTTEANLGDGLFPVPEYIKLGGKFGIGSDSHISVDAREELRLLEYGQRLARQQRTVLTDAGGGHTGEYLWREAAKGGAQALAQPIGEITVGKRADLLVINRDTPMMAGSFYGQVMDSFIFSGQNNPITDVMVAGVWQVRGGKHVDEDEIFGAYKETVSKIAMAMGADQ